VQKSKDEETAAAATTNPPEYTSGDENVINAEFEEVDKKKAV
jgi:hypothetical protein